MSIVDRLVHAWDLFKGRDPTQVPKDLGYASSDRPDRPRYNVGNERTIVAAVLTRIAMDASSIRLEHVRLDAEGKYVETIKSSLNEVLTVSANIDQTGRAFIQDVVGSMLDEGTVCIVPTKSDYNPNNKEVFKIEECRVGKIAAWFPEHVQVYLYNPTTGSKDYFYYRKDAVAIIENPMYAVMNQPNSTLQRLMRKLALLDACDEETSTGKLNMIVQLPYTIKTDAKKKLAKSRLDDLQKQLNPQDNKLGICYIDATEKITQLNRPLENNLLAQVEYLTNLLYSQLGITAEILNGTADENAMNNYYNRLIEPILSSIADEMIRKFLTKTARSQGQSICFFRDLFKLMPVNNVAEVADKFTRNEIATSNEIRQFIGLKPSKDPRANELRNSNISEAKDAVDYDVNGNPVDNFQNEGEDEEAALEDVEAADAELNEIERELNHGAFDGIGMPGTYATNSDIIHYASKYYDPVKAHEYYEEHKKLKGRQKVTLTEEGRAIARNVKENMNAEKKSVLKRSNEAHKATIKSNSAHLRNKVESLNKFLKQLSPKEREVQKERIQKMISSLRLRNNAIKEKLQEKHSNTNDSIRDEYKRKYEAEVENIKKEHGKVSGGGKSGGSKVTRYLKRNCKS